MPAIHVCCFQVTHSYVCLGTNTPGLLASPRNGTAASRPTTEPQPTSREDSMDPHILGSSIWQPPDVGPSARLGKTGGKWSPSPGSDTSKDCVVQWASWKQPGPCNIKAACGRAERGGHSEPQWHILVLDAGTPAATSGRAQTFQGHYG